MPVLAMGIAVLISIMLVGLAATLWYETDSPIPANIQRRFDRHDELSIAWVEFIATHGHAPTTAELWALVPPELGGEE